MEGRFNGGFFALRAWGAYIWRGLYMEGLILGILRYTKSTYYNINSLGYLFVMFTTIIAFDVMSLGERTLREVVSPGRTLRYRKGEKPLRASVCFFD